MTEDLKNQENSAADESGRSDGSGRSDEAGNAEGPSGTSKNHDGYFRSAKATPHGVQNLFDPGKFRVLDKFRILGVANAGNFPFFVLSNSGLGTMIRISFVNGKAWDEAQRDRFLEKLENGFTLENQEPTVDYTYSFSVVRSPLRAEDLEGFKDKNHPLSMERTKFLADLGEKLHVQNLEFYFGITASPAESLVAENAGMWERIKSYWDPGTKMKIENKLFEEIYNEFNEKVKSIVALFANEGISFDPPRSEKDLLMMARRAWRPNYREAEVAKTDAKDKNSGGGGGGSSESIDDRSLRKDSYISPGDFICRDLKATTFSDHWIADGCLNIMLSMEDAPDPNQWFSSFEIDKILKLGIKPGVSILPYSGTYTVAWSSLTRDKANQIFKIKNTIASGMRSNQSGMFEDRQADMEAEDIDRMYDEFLTSRSDMVRGSITYTLSIPLEFIKNFFDLNSPTEQELLKSIVRRLKTDLEDIGFSKWAVEKGTYYPTWINLIPGAIRNVDGVQYIPRSYLSLKGILHLIPFYSTIGPDQKEFNGANYFITDESSIFIFDHFSKNNGTAANFSVCGSTGSGKSVTVQSLIMMNEKKDPNIMVLDFGGGNIGSWTKLCDVWGGCELKFGSARPPRINPFELAEADSFPNTRKRREICLWLGIDADNLENHSDIENVYVYLRADDNFRTPKHIRQEAVAQRCSAFKGKTFEETWSILTLRPGYTRPGEKGAASIKMILELLLANNVEEDGPTDNPWSTFSQDDINEAILELYENYLPQANHPEYWPTLGSFRSALESLRGKRLSNTDKWGMGDIAEYGLLMSRLSNYCQDGIDNFMDGQTNVNIRQRKMVNGEMREVPASFILADMAGISSKRKLAIYMITINDYMSNILYNSGGEKRGIIIRDEAWLFMRSKIAAPYLEADYRLARKYGFSVITIAQNYSDFKSAVLQNNTQTWVVCALATDDEINLANVRFKFNRSEREMFESKTPGIKMGTTLIRDITKGTLMDVYSKIMVSTAAGKFFVKNKIGKIERWITTTDAEETFVFNYYREIKFKGKPAIEIINWLCEGHYRKDEDLKAALLKSGRKMPDI
jgi:hypothetical protein